MKIVFYNYLLFHICYSKLNLKVFLNTELVCAGSIQCLSKESESRGQQPECKQQMGQIMAIFNLNTYNAPENYIFSRMLPIERF